MNIIPNTYHPSLNQDGKTVTELFVSIGYLSLIVKGWLMITMNHKTFRMERRMCCGPFVFFICVAVFKLLAF